MSERFAQTMSPRVSIILRSRNDGWCIRETVAAIRSQQRDDFELVAVDNASTDGSVEVLEQAADRLIHIPEGEYEPGPVLNAAVGESCAPIIVLVNSDATPQHTEWLERLLAPLDDPTVGAVYGRQIPRPDASPAVVFDLARAYPDRPKAEGGPHFFSFVSAAFRRSLWEQRPFWTRGYAEDYEWTLHARRAGHRLVYAHDSVVMHSHNYTSRQMWRKKHRHGRADALVHGRPTPLRRALLDAARDVARDTLHLLPRGHLWTVLRSPYGRLLERLAFHRGSLAGMHAGGAPPAPRPDVRNGGPSGDRPRSA